MGSRRRRRPAHADPAKEYATNNPELTFAERSLAAIEANERQPGVFGTRCVFPTCNEYIDPHLQIFLCRGHALLVRDALNDEAAERERRLDAIGADIEARRARGAEKLDAGQPLARGDLAPGWVYYVAVDDLIKVGFTKSVMERMRQYPPNAKLLAVEPGTRRVERERHGLLSAQLAKGREWFHDSPEVREWVDKVLAEYGSPERFEYPWTEPTRSKQQTRLKRQGYAL